MKENPKAIWERRGRSIYPVNEEAEAMLRSVKDRSQFPGEIHGVRSVQQLRLYWGGLMKLLVEQGIFPSKEAASDATKIAAGHVETIIMPDTGEVSFKPKHINFGSLSAAEFNEVFEVMLNVICERWLGAPEYDTARELAFDMLDDPALRALGRKVTRKELEREGAR